MPRAKGVQAGVSPLRVLPYRERLRQLHLPWLPAGVLRRADPGGSPGLRAVPNGDAHGQRWIGQLLTVCGWHVRPRPRSRELHGLPCRRHLSPGR